MLEPVEFSGYWWLPENPNQRIAGICRFSQENGCHLELFGLFGDAIDFFKPPHAPTIILGESSEGSKVTLYQCFLSNREGSFLKGSGHSTYYNHFLLNGVNFFNEDDMSFTEMTVSYTDLDDWLGMRNIEIAEDHKSIEFHPTEPIEIDINNTFRLSIVGETQIKSSRMGHDVSIFERFSLKLISLRGKINLIEFLQNLRILSNFLVLGVGRLVYPISITGSSDGAKIELQNGSYYFPPIGIFYQLLELPNIRGILFRGNMLFTFIDIRENLADYLRNWFISAEEIPAVHDLFFGSFYTQRLFVNHRFLNIIQGLETYHRSRFCNEEIPKAKHKQRLTEISNSAPDQYKDWLEEKLRYSNEPSFRKRLRELVSRYSEIMKPYIPDEGAFISKIVDTRNHFTHHAEIRSAITNTLELHAATETLMVLLESVLLTELGFTVDEITLLQ